MRTRLLLLALSLPLVTWWAIAADGPPTGNLGDEQDLIFFHPARPLLLRLHVQIDGQPFPQHWNDYLEQLTRYLDADGDGVLSPAELEHAPSPQQLLEQLQGAAVIQPDAPPELQAVNPTPGARDATCAQLQGYYRHAGVGPLQIEWRRRSGGVDGLSEVLFQYLDQDLDGKLSRAELEAAASVLHPLDTNDDEVITVDELFAQQVAAPRPPDIAGRSPSPSPVRPPVLLLHAGDSPDLVAGELLQRYDRDKDGKLSRSEIALDKVTFDQLDANHDGQLDAIELRRWLFLPPDVELRLQLGAGPVQEMTTILSLDGHGQPLISALRPTRFGGLRLMLPDMEISLIPSAGARARQTAARSALRASFRQFDVNGDGFLDSREAAQPPFTLVSMLRLADRDGDGKLSEKELNAYLDLEEKALGAALQLTVADRGSSLFEFLDTDHDGRLSQRELRTAWSRLAPWDRDGDGCISRQEIPPQFYLFLTEGQPARMQGLDGLPVPGSTMRALARQRGPLWFRKMDRNGDGDLSLREFMGTAEDFRRIDTDGDGLIDAAEAERADLWFRQRQGRGR
jgi:Ca2+-binding EF-hand superfamily protein